MVSLVSIMLLIVSVVCARDKVTRDVSLLPAGAREMIKTYFPDSEISYLKIDKKLFRIEGYEVILAGGTELEFDAKGQWTEIESLQTVPDSIVPEAIRKYIKRYYGP